MVENGTELSEFNGKGKSVSSTTNLMADDSEKGGCRVTIVTGFILVLFAILIAVGVGILVFFAGDEFRKHEACDCAHRNGVGSGQGGGERTTTAKPGGKMTTMQTANKTMEEMCIQNCKDGIPCVDPSTTTSPKTTMGPEIPTKPPTDVRLPTNLEPLKYTAEIKPNIYSGDPKEFNFDGIVEIDIHCNNATDWIILHISDLSINNDSLKVLDSNDSMLPYSHWEEDKPRMFMKIKMIDPLKTGENYTVKMNYSAHIIDNLKGLYYTSYFSQLQNKTVYYVGTTMEPVDARRVLPLFDEPEIKSVFVISIVRKRHMKALANMPLVETVEREDDWVVDHFAPTVKMSTYLLALAVCDFDYLEQNISSRINVRVWAPKEVINDAQYALDLTVRSIIFFEDFFNIPYPLPKLDSIVLYDFITTAMENWGLIVYRPRDFLYNANVSSDANKQGIAQVIMHEISHQWFGNIVSPAWWDDLWLNEGFARYMEFVAGFALEPEMKVDDYFVTNVRQMVMVTDQKTSSHPIYVPVKHPDEIWAIFDAISYDKGASVLLMMHKFIGDKTFKDGLSRYLKKYLYDTATHNGLWDTLSEQAVEDGTNLDVKEIMNTWILQMGFPLITVDTNDTTPSGNPKVKQTYFLQDPESKWNEKYISPYSYKWEVPFTFTTDLHQNWHGNDSDYIIWLHKTDAYLPLPRLTGTKWMVGNVQQHGFYRVNYDLQNWRALLQQLADDHTMIHLKNRAQIIDDLFNLARAGTAPVDIKLAMDATLYLEKETEHIPWEAVSRNMNYIQNMLKKSMYYGNLRKYLVKKILPLYDLVGWNDEGSLSEKLRRQNTIQFACNSGYQPCRENASKLFKQWMDDPDPGRNNPIPQNLRNSVYCNAIRNGGDEEWEFAYDRSKKGQVESDNKLLLAALACTKEPWLLNRLLNYSMTPSEIRKVDSTFVMAAVAHNDAGAVLTWNFVKERWGTFSKYGVNTLGYNYFIDVLTASFNSEYELRDLEMFIKTQGNLGPATRPFSQAVDNTKANIKWVKNNMKMLAEWLEQNP